MKTFHVQEILTFLQAVDRHLATLTEVRIIGGAAAALGFGAQQGTMDIDHRGVSSPGIDSTTASTEFARACAHARAETRLDIPVNHVGVHEAPWASESRYQPASLAGVTKLKVLIPEKHDWALMKISRLDQKDIDHIKEATARVGFDRELFLRRFVTEMSHVEPRKPLIQRFVAMMEELYGESESDRMKAAVDDIWSGRRECPWPIPPA